MRGLYRGHKKKFSIILALLLVFQLILSTVPTFAGKDEVEGLDEIEGLEEV